LFESRRVPEIVIIIKCKEKATFDRIINRDAIRAEFNRLIQAREAEKKRQREEDRATYITEIRQDEEKTPEEIEELIATWDDNRDTADKEADENDPEMPNYDAMEQVEREKLIE
jgi:dephospho-CoA kinase